MEENNTKVVVGGVVDSMQLKSSRSQSSSPDGTANNQADMNKVGQSVFYGNHLDLSPTAEKQDFMKPEQSDTDEESMFFLVNVLSHFYRQFLRVLLLCFYCQLLIFF